MVHPSRGSASPEPELPPGVTARNTLRGHEDHIWAIAWSPDGRLIATGSSDRTLRVWDALSGRLLRTHRGHTDRVLSVAFHPTGVTLATGGADRTIRIWDTYTGALLRTLDVQEEWVYSVAYHPDGGILVSGDGSGVIRLWNAAGGSPLGRIEAHKRSVKDLAYEPRGHGLVSAGVDGTVALWNPVSGAPMRMFPHGDLVWSATFDPTGLTLLTAGRDRSIKVWDVQSGVLLRTLEGHRSGIETVAVSSDGRLLASKDDSGGEVRLWRCDTWDPLGVIPAAAVPTDGSWRLAWSPQRLQLATVAGAGAEPNSIQVWDLDADLLLRRRSEPATVRAVHHTTAKVVLVGDHSVGKSALGYRLVHGEFREQASTHGQQFWVYPELGTRRQDGTQCEAILWDLAGQPDYRLIHALFLDDADLALVLFDASDIRDPLHGVAFWLKQLQAGGTRCPTLLVGAQADRGTPTLTGEELETFCRQHGIAAHVRTSARTGEGLEALVERMKALVPWDQKPATVTTATFKRIKDYVLGLKEVETERRTVVDLAELSRRLRETDPRWSFADDEVETAVGHLENYGYVKRLRTSGGEARILLAPDLLNNLASSFVLEARRNPRGLGSLEEKRLLEGGYAFPELEALSAEERSVLLDAAALLFLEHNVCFRETDPLNAQSYLVFPELINLKKPPLENEAPTEDGVAYTVSGAVENVYASLVVLLGYTSTFTRTNQWQNHARYEVGDGLVCGFRQDAERDGELDFVLYFGTKVGRPVRTLFQSLVESFLARRNLTILRFEPVVCPKGHHLNRAVVREQLREGDESAFCSKCGAQVALPAAGEPIQLTRDEQALVDEQRRTAEQRTRFEQAVFQLQGFVKEQGIAVPECFVSYAWGVPEHERWVEHSLATDLQKAGLVVVLDRWENARIGASVSRFVERAGKSDRVLVVGTPLYREKYEKGGFAAAAEGDLVGTRMLGSEAEKETVLPLLLDGSEKTSLPLLLQGRVYADFREPRNYFATVFELILSLYGISPRHQAVADLLDSLREPERL
ncbi:MAG TPA: GTP-binding protein, partial [Longimicrobiaceae bacterium]|nr:GTP-binding protein [Longimicrobiaceae bacterium]